MKQYIRKYFFVTMLYIMFPLLYNVQPLNAGFDMGNISEEDMIAMQQELQAQIDSMSDAERESFYQIMENVERMSQEDPAALERFITGNMSKEEEAEFVKTMVPEAEPTTQASAQPTEEPVKAAPQEQPKTEALTEAQLSLQEMIISCIAKMESFLVKMQSYPEINTRIRSWTKKNSLTAWPEGKQWKDVEFDINMAVQKLSAIEHEKNKNKKRALIDAFSKNDALMSSLTALNNALITHEKNVDIAPFGIIKIKKETKTAMQKILNVLTSELYNAQMNSQLTEVLKSYEAEDKKLKEGEDALIKKAQQDIEKSRPKEYMKSAGQEKSSSRSSSNRSSYGSDYGNYGGGYGGNYDNYSSYPNSYDSYDYDSYPSSRSKSSSSKGGSSGGSSARAGGSRGSEDDLDFDESEEKPGKSSSSQTTTPTNATKKPASGGTKNTRQKIDPKGVLIYTMEEYLKDIQKIIGEKKKEKEPKTPELLNETFRDLVTYITTKHEPEELESLNAKIAKIVRHLTGPKSVSDSLKSLKIKLNKESAEVKADYKKQVKDLYNEYKTLLEKLFLQIKNVEEHWDDIEKSIPFSNMYALWNPAVAYLPTSIATAPQALNERVKTPLIAENAPLKDTGLSIVSADDGTETPVDIKNESPGIPEPIEEKTKLGAVVSTQAKEIVERIPEVTTLKELKAALGTLNKEIKEFVK